MGEAFTEQIMMMAHTEIPFIKSLMLYMTDVTDLFLGPELAEILIVVRVK